MQNYLISEAIGDIAGSAYEGKSHRIKNLWKCANEHRHAGFGSKFKLWMASHNPRPYRSFGNGAAMRCSSAGWLAQTEEECIRMAHKTMAYAYYKKMPDTLVYQALKKLPDWMVDVSERFDDIVNKVATL